MDHDQRTAGHQRLCELGSNRVAELALRSSGLEQDEVPLSRGLVCRALKNVGDAKGYVSHMG